MSAASDRKVEALLSSLADDGKVLGVEAGGSLWRILSGRSQVHLWTETFPFWTEDLLASGKDPGRARLAEAVQTAAARRARRALLRRKGLLGLLFLPVGLLAAGMAWLFSKARRIGLRNDEDGRLASPQGAIRGALALLSLPFGLTALAWLSLFSQAEAAANPIRAGRRRGWSAGAPSAQERLEALMSAEDGEGHGLDRSGHGGG